MIKVRPPEKHKATALLESIVFSIYNCFSPALLSVQCFSMGLLVNPCRFLQYL